MKSKCRPIKSGIKPRHRLLIQLIPTESPDTSLKIELIFWVLVLSDTAILSATERFTVLSA